MLPLNIPALLLNLRYKKISILFANVLFNKPNIVFIKAYQQHIVT